VEAIGVQQAGRNNHKQENMIQKFILVTFVSLIAYSIGYAVFKEIRCKLIRMIS
jgi:hypothetical protein